MSSISKLKQGTKSVLRPPVKAAWPLIEQSAQISSAFSPERSGLKIVRSGSWTPLFDQLLDALPPPPGCTMDQYRALVQETEYRKHHALILERSEPVALISLRRRNQFWEPVAYQALSGYIAPARDNKILGRALRSLGMDIVAGAGLGEDVLEMGPSSYYDYEFVRVDLQSDYQAYWDLEDRKHHKHVSSARKKCKRMHMVVNDKDDIEWIVNTWRDVWKDSPENEIVAAPDRIRFWKTLPTSSARSDQLTVQVHTLYDGEERVAGTIATSMNGIQMGQCQVQLPEYRNRGAGTRILDLTLEHSAKEGFIYHDFGGGQGYKSLWGPLQGKRYSALFRPRIIDLFRRIRSK